VAVPSELSVNTTVMVAMSVSFISLFVLAAGAG
jgi:preprotein translocase subunit SecE